MKDQVSLSLTGRIPFILIDGSIPFFIYFLIVKFFPTVFERKTDRTLFSLCSTW